jgi:hypothetical protein
MPEELTFEAVDAGVRQAIAAYTQALDDGRTDAVVATFCADGAVDIPGMGAHAGTEALQAAYARVVPRLPQRHLVLNTLITAWSADAGTASATSDVVFLLLRDGAWSTLLVGRYDDELRREADGVWRFTSRRATFLP